MRIDRLFHSLVIHGGLLVAACDDGKDGSSDERGPTDDGPSDGDVGASTDDGSEDPGPGSSTSETGSSEAGSGEAGTSEAGTSEAGTSEAGTGDAGSSEAGSSEAGTSEGETGGGPLECSRPPQATDTCGCPCCWASDCVNTDECCAGFSELCTPA